MSDSGQPAVDVGVAAEAASIATAVRRALEGLRPRVSRQELMWELGISKEVASAALKSSAETADGSEQGPMSLDCVVAADLADGTREFRLIPTAALKTEPSESADVKHVEVHSVRRSPISTKDAAGLQWLADLDSCWDAYRPPAQDLPPSRPPAAAAAGAHGTVVVDLSDSDSDAECRMLRDA
ncbi:hypothetical protein AK812_SmicGene16739 [Symbiodinium microadriaticum]|uniref:Uncharacterized protein n=1 Tax=Symbiodinium microadriaticum TaxID=2951 RepID=A0A1Q9DZI7_SYMMI|nr:hypothetical protein AK812_SmicGene16739 [Symbiodinium microadriaticum]CAE7838336.1 unnamed protein product [Symbiodinium microadriaticum]